MLPPNEDDIKKVNALIKDIKTAMLTTEAPDGRLHSRPMVTQKVDFDGTLWFFTDNPSDKISHIQHNMNVNVGYMKGNTFVSVAGKATLNTDVEKKKELWHPELDIWFEEGPESSKIALLRVLAKSAEYWDGPDNVLSKAISVVRVFFTHNEDAFGENESVRFGE
jgi:general stress protein 26